MHYLDKQHIKDLNQATQTAVATTRINEQVKHADDLTNARIVGQKQDWKEEYIRLNSEFLQDFHEHDQLAEKLEITTKSLETTTKSLETTWKNHNNVYQAIGNLSMIQPPVKKTAETARDGGD